MRRIGANTNTYEGEDVVAPAGILLNATNFINLAPARDRIGYTVSNPSAIDILVKESDAAIPDSTTRRGFIVAARSMYSSPPDRIYKGAISAISVAGNPTVYITEQGT